MAIIKKATQNSEVKTIRTMNEDYFYSDTFYGTIKSIKIPKFKTALKNAFYSLCASIIIATSLYAYSQVILTIFSKLF